MLRENGCISRTMQAELPLDYDTIVRHFSQFESIRVINARTFIICRGEFACKVGIYRQAIFFPRPRWSESPPNEPIEMRHKSHFTSFLITHILKTSLLSLVRFFNFYIYFIVKLINLLFFDNTIQFFSHSKNKKGYYFHRPPLLLYHWSRWNRWSDDWLTLPERRYFLVRDKIRKHLPLNDDFK